jgi:Spy/CpxP family protein refolding chaperone
MSKFLTPKIVLVNATIFCLIALVAGGLTILAQPGGKGPMHGRGPGHHDGMMMGRILHHLDLTDEQRDQIHAILDSAKPEDADQRREEMRAARRSLHEAIMDPAATDEQVLAAAREVSSLEEQRALIHHKIALEIQNVLTEEQKAELEKMKERMAEREGSPPPHGQGRFHRGR